MILPSVRSWQGGGGGALSNDSALSPELQGALRAYALVQRSETSIRQLRLPGFGCFQGDGRSRGGFVNRTVASASGLRADVVGGVIFPRYACRFCRFLDSEASYFRTAPQQRRRVALSSWRVGLVPLAPLTLRLHLCADLAFRTLQSSPRYLSRAEGLRNVRPCPGI